MNEQGLQSEENQAEEGINLWELFDVILKRKMMIFALVVLSTCYGTFYSLSLENVYQSVSVIQPADQRMSGGGVDLAAKLGGLASIAGISMPASSGANELVAILTSKILKEKMIKRYDDLLPILFESAWDKEKGTWKGSPEMSPSSPTSTIEVEKDGSAKQFGPTMLQGKRTLQSIIRVDNWAKEGTIRVSVEFNNPEKAALILTYCLETLKNTVIESAKRVADTNRKYLEELILSTSDPVIQYKIYELIAQNVEKSMMTQVKEEFAYKMIDPPMVDDLRIRPQRSKLVLTFFFTSLFLGLFLALIIEPLMKMKHSAAVRKYGVGKLE